MGYIWVQGFAPWQIALRFQREREWLKMHPKCTPAVPARGAPGAVPARQVASYARNPQAFCLLTAMQLVV